MALYVDFLKTNPRVCKIVSTKFTFIFLHFQNNFSIFKKDHDIIVQFIVN